jgi:hypothetical protein
MQPTIHLEGKAEYSPISSFTSKCIVGCIFNSAGFFITRESPCIMIKQTIVESVNLSIKFYPR